MQFPTSLLHYFRLFLLTSIALFSVADIGRAQTCDCAFCKAGISLDITGADTIIRIDRWNRTATNNTTGSLGTPITLTWSIARDGQDFTAVGTTPSDLVSFLDERWSTSGPATSFETRAWFGPLKQGFERWGEISGVSFVYEPNDSGNFGAAGILGVRGDVRVGGIDIDGSGGTLARNFLPDGGEMVLDTTEVSALNPVSSNSNRRFRNVISHEHGHGLGLDHIIDDVAGATFLMNPALSQAFDGPQFHDILAVQRGYGDALEKNGGNDTLATATPLGMIGDGMSAGAGFDTPDLGGNPSGIAIEQTDLISIDDNSDTDFFQFSVDGPSTTTIVLNPRGPSYGAVIQGNPQQETMEFNGSEQSDLVLAIFDQSGSLLSEVDATGLGVNETISELQLPEAGNYFVRVTGKANAAQMYSVEVFVTSGLTETQIIYSISGDTAFGNNGASAGTGPTFGDNMDGTFTLANATNSGNNNAVFIESSDGGSVSTLLGRELSMNDSVRVSGTVASADVDYRANGVEFGLHSAAGFRAQPNLLFQIDADGARGGFAAGFGTPTPAVGDDRAQTPGATEASLNDGYTFVARYSPTDITYTVSNITTTNETGSEPDQATSFTFSLSDAAAADPALSIALDDYVANYSTIVGDSFAYFSHQNSGGGTSSTFSNFEIAVTTVATDLLGDFNLDDVVDCADLDGYIGNIGEAADGPLVALDIDGNGTLDASDADTHITTLIETSNGAVGTFAGDLNCDGTVDVLGDAFALVASLGSAVTMYSQGDINFDGEVDVLGDAFELIANLGMSNE